MTIVTGSDNVTIVVNHHVWGHLETSTIVVVVNGPEVIFASALFLVIGRGCITQLRFVFLVFLDLGLMIKYFNIGVIHVLNKTHLLRAFLRDLNLTSTRAIRNNVLSSSRSILHVCNLGLSLTSSLSYSLNGSNNFLLILSRRWSTLFNFLSWFGFVNL